MASGKYSITSRLIAITAIIALVTIFTLQNADTVTIQVYYWQISTSRAMMIFTIMLAGIVIGWFGRGSWSRRRR